MHAPSVETHFIRSHHVDQVFKIQVMCPARHRTEESRFPVVYATDGNLMFDALKGISHSIQTPERDVPRFILVGIGYPSDMPFAGTLLRARDLTFPQYPDLGTERPSVDGTLAAVEGTKDFYGAEDFQRFIECELIPVVDQQYETIPGDRTYFGHSAGGGFGLFTLFEKSDLFKSYIVSSPGVTYHGVTPAGIRYENYDFMLSIAREFIASGKSLDGVKLYLSVGTAEEFEPALTEWRLTSSFYRLANLLKGAGIEGLELTTEAIEGETHATAWPIAFIHGLKAVLCGNAGADRFRKT